MLTNHWLVFRKPIGPAVLSVEFALFQRGHAVDGFVVFGAGDDTPAFVE